MDLVAFGIICCKVELVKDAKERGIFLGSSRHAAVNWLLADKLHSTLTHVQCALYLDDTIAVGWHLTFETH